MIDHSSVRIRTLCHLHGIDESFVHALHHIGRIEIIIIDHDQYIAHTQMGDFEKMVRMHRDLNINIEGIDVILNLLENEIDLRHKIHRLSNKLRCFDVD